ncbi:GNAT family N-acetyltransferase [Actinoplanes subtropicus]|uniref:GNAT family N-acetyltransferase n=1 Tax=Actinoplanes subtropicus TaxID=543632 RepID=UPI0004C3133F|nr:GNAT family N-acetyltransferase [Actinoplanes subtropicus]
MDRIDVRQATAVDHSRIVDLLTRSWGSTIVVAHGVVYDAATLPALLAERRGRLAGLLTYAIEGDAFEVVSLDAVVRGAGTGTLLLDAAAEQAERGGLRRLWLVTTNDNLDALRFYQRRGMRLVGVAAGAVDESRKLKPGIPLVGDFDIEIHDELTLELRLPRPGSRP